MTPWIDSPNRADELLLIYPCLVSGFLLLHVIVEESGSTLSTVVSIVMLGHEAADSGHWTVLPKTSYLSIRLNTIVLQGLKRDGLVGTFYLFWLGVNLLLTLLTTSTKTEHQVKGTFLLNIVVT